MKITRDRIQNVHRDITRDLEVAVLVVEVVLVTVEDLQLVLVPAQTSVGFGVLTGERHLHVLLLTLGVFEDFNEAVLRLKNRAQR